MPNPMKTEAIKAFLTKFAPADLAELYSYNMEVQVTVARDNGERVEGEYKGRVYQAYTNGLETWKPIRIPRNANTVPEYEDSPMGYDLAAHAEGIGMTGWDWVSRESRWVAFDFDAITGHSEKHAKKLTEAQLDEIRQALHAVPCVTIRRSTGGKGLHLYVFLEPVSTANHNEHAAVARAVLSHLSGLTGFDLPSKVDICGGNMWVWHRKMAGTPGLTIVKRADVLMRVPENWREYTKVVSGARSRVLPRFVEDQLPVREDADSVFEELTGQRIRVKPDETHKRVMDWLFTNYGSCSWWEAEHHMLVTHTAALKRCHEELQLRGAFETNAVGTDLGSDYNCFSGDTRVITRQGHRTLRELAAVGRAELYVWTPDGMRWIDCPVRSFGRQKTVPLIFGDGSYVRTTRDHQWVTLRHGKPDLANKVQTYQIIPGKTQLAIARLELPEIDWEGYAHGFVFGDGWRAGEGTEVSLFKHDEDLKSLLTRYGTLGSKKFPSHGYVNTVRQLPGHWKEFPENPTREYALGFVLGLVSADGFVDSKTQVFQTGYEKIHEIRELALHAGLRAYEIREMHRSEGCFETDQTAYAITISNYNLGADHFLRRDQREKFSKRQKHSAVTVSYIGSDVVEEEVFCAVVPHWQNFTLSNLVVTSNCFMFPISRGAWAVRRFTLGVAEHPTWEQDGAQWTRCFYNREPDLHSAARLHGGVERAEGGYWFQMADEAQKAAALLGVDLGLPPWITNKPTILKIHKSGRLVVEVEKDSTSANMKDWLVKGKKFERVFSMRSAGGSSEPEALKIDDSLRHLISERGEDCGWVIRTDGNWHSEPYHHVKVWLTGQGHKDPAFILSSSISQCWMLVNRPFAPEYPKDRQWNRDAAQLRFKPTQDRDDLKYPTWMRILRHVGKSLDYAVSLNDWCKSNSILTGADYLKCWIASLFQEPMEPLPYLFFHGPQNSGKSIFHEALSLLMTKGVVRADLALTNQQGFNGEIAQAVLCVVEETDLKKNQVAYNRIKDWVTSRELPVHPKNKTPYSAPNSTHWVQCANSHTACPIFPGDTRITMILVDSLDPKDLIPKKLIIPLLEAEAPDFLAEVLGLELPPSNDRLNVPVVATEDKTDAEYFNKSYLELFVEEKCFAAPGHRVRFKEFYDRFMEFVPAEYSHHWSAKRVGSEFPRHYAKGRDRSTNEVWIGNLSFTKIEEKDFGPRYILREGKLYVDDQAVSKAIPMANGAH